MDVDYIEDEYPDYDDQVEYIKTVPAKKAEYVNSEDYLPLKLSDNLPFDDLYSHQGEGLKKLSNGKDICVTTPTSSGKTLIYALHIARRILQSKNETALLIYPTKALSRDQKQELEDIYSNFNLDINIGVYDGDASQERKREIRNNCNVVISNFQGMNYYLAHHEKWNSIFENLGTIVVDEAHTYTGIQGIHVSWIIRRIRRIVEKEYRSKPQFILSSATIGNPYEHASRLTGLEFDVINNDGSPRGKRDILVWNPPTYYNNDVLERKSPHKETSDITSYLISRGQQCLTFAPSRKMTELCSKWTQEKLDEDFAGEFNVRSYNAGHRKEDRREVEDELKGEDIDGVISTTALELGIDIGSVDVTVMDGYPGKRASFWQQAGRSGRGEQNSISFLISRHDSIDQYIADNPDFLFDEDVENAVIDLDNVKILASHLMVASNEKPLSMRDSIYFSEGPLISSLNLLRSNGLVSGDIRSGSVNYTGDNPRPESEIDLYSTSEEQYDIVIEIENEDDENEEHNLPSVDKSRAFREFHPNAVYMYNGNQYIVDDFDRDNKKVKLEYADVDYYTQSGRTVEIKDLTYNESRKIGSDIVIKRGTGTISESYATYSKIYFNNKEKESNLPTGLNEPIEIETDIMWIELSQKLAENINIKSSVDGLMGSLHAAEHGLIKMSPTEITADPKDLGGLSVSNHKVTGNPTIFIYDGVGGGVGFSHEIYKNIKKLSRRTNDLLHKCECESDHGCPACTMSSMCGDNNEPMDSVGAQALLKQIYVD